MKYLSVIILTLIIGLGACEIITFKTEQPIDGQRLYEVPKKFHGEWLLTEEGTEKDSLIIDKTKIVWVITDDEVDHKDSIKIENQKVLIESDIPGIKLSPYIMKGDSIYYTTYYHFPDIELNRDSFFIKKINNNAYALNFVDVDSEDGFQIYLLEKKKRDILIKSLVRSDLKYIEQVKKITIDSTMRNSDALDIKMSRKEMNKLLKLGGFSEIEIYAPKQNKIK